MIGQGVRPRGRLSNDRNEIENGITLKDLDTKIEGRYDKADELRFGADKMSDREFELREKLLGQ
jgi:hypothetical protein